MRHLTAILSCINRWEHARMRQYHLDAQWAEDNRVADVLTACMYRAREEMETTLARAQHLAASVVQRIPGLYYGAFHHESGYLGNQELDPGRMQTMHNHGLVHHWIARRPTGLWFDLTGAVHSPIQVAEDDDDEELAMPSVLLQFVPLDILGCGDWEDDFDPNWQLLQPHQPPNPSPDSSLSVPPSSPPPLTNEMTDDTPGKTSEEMPDSGGAHTGLSVTETAEKNG
jgi:hypothetical protein